MSHLIVTQILLYPEAKEHIKILWKLRKITIMNCKIIEGDSEQTNNKI